ncbi:RecQ mediated genome instability protein-like protein Rmi1 [Lineolata rhizophorae]|uniref:RecQ-mediated genome instability protein 1 n=1 Tax=Lineolata rhizophorae TaxID=578093 RepID=A0A6A6P6X8_9PEZI|nr:RecQ mediated genome instability protein-like protein Rmi1 [Lineolata rhizophorae]
MAFNSLKLEISTHLASKGLKPTQAWLDSILPTLRPNTPLPALKQTALYRLLASDFTLTLQSSRSILPSDILDARIKERRIIGSVPVQVIDIEDIGRSRWSQVEALEAAERGETTKGREIIRVVPSEDSTDADTTNSSSAGPHKLLLQDAKGTEVYGLEIENIDKVDVNMNIGTKLLLKNVVVARGVLLLTPERVDILGGKIDLLHKTWKENRKEDLAPSGKEPTKLK